jgi:hypothetical protein
MASGTLGSNSAEEELGKASIFFNTRKVIGTSRFSRVYEGKTISRCKRIQQSFPRSFKIRRVSGFRYDECQGFGDSEHFCFCIL